MKKLKLNKKTVSVLDKKEMKTIKGGDAGDGLSTYTAPYTTPLHCPTDVPLD